MNQAFNTVLDNKHEKINFMENTIPRRCRLDLMTPAELAIRNAILEIEKLGCDTKLTDIVFMLDKAKDLTSDFIDSK